VKLYTEDVFENMSRKSKFY